MVDIVICLLTVLSNCYQTFSDILSHLEIDLNALLTRDL